MKKLLLIAALITLPQLSFATGLHECEPIANEDWISEDALTQRLENDGWQVRRMKVDGGCWEVYGTTPEGQRVEGYFHPETGEMLLLSQRGRIIFEAEGTLEY